MEKLLFTGGTGFLGANAKPILDQQYEVTTIGITDKDELKANLANEVPILPYHYDVVLHAAGKAHVYPKTEAEKKAFFDINYQGTVNLCSALEKVGVPSTFVFISTANVYTDDCNNYVTEDAPLKGESPYAKSKIMAEEFLLEWSKKQGVKLGILRPSLMAGKNAPGNLGAMVNGIKTGRYLSINHGKAQKSLLMAADIARLVPLIESSNEGGIFNVCDSENPTFGQLEAIIAKQLGKKPPISIPFWIAKCLALCGDILGDKFPINSKRLEKIVTPDTLNSEKARKELGWEPLRVLDYYVI